MDVAIQIDPAALPSAQHKGVNHRTGRVYTKPRVMQAKRAVEVALWQAVRAKYGHGINVAYPLCARKGAELEAWGVEVEYVYRPRRLTSRMAGAPKATRPDVDNLTKLVLDAIMGSRLAFSDDGQVTQLLVSKRFARVGEAAHIRISTYLI